MVRATQPFAHARRSELESIDINPLIVLPQGQGATVVDALIVASGAKRATGTPSAR